MPFKGLMVVVGITIIIQSMFAANGNVCYNLPQFGFYIDGYGQILDRAPDSNEELWLRTIADLINEWKSPYLVKEPKKTVSDEMRVAWRANAFIAVERRYAHLKEVRELKNMEDLISCLAKEYEEYGLSLSKFKGCIRRVNKLLADKWMWGILGGKTTITTYYRQAVNTYRSGIDYVEREMRNLMVPINTIHRQEFLKWKEQNPDLYARLKKQDDDLINNVVLQKKIDAATEEARLAKEQAAAAEAAAWAAEQAARDAEDAANRARWRRW